MPSRSPWGSGEISHHERMERASREIIRRTKLEAKNDPAFVPPPDDASAILAARKYAAAPSAFGTPLRVPWSLVERDGAGGFQANHVELTAIVASLDGSGYDFVLFAADAVTAILRNPSGTLALELPLGSDFKVGGKFGCNNKLPQASAPVGGAAGGASGGASAPGGTAGATYTAAEQGLVNALLGQMAANAGVINAQAGAINTLVSLVNTMRDALIANGILI